MLNFQLKKLQQLIKETNNTMLQKYRDYINDNPKGYWFKSKPFGWWWTPVTWQGWLVIAIYIILVVGFSLTIDETSPTREVMFTFLLPIFLLTITLIRICYKKGETPHWNWGWPKKK